MLGLNKLWFGNTNGKVVEISGIEKVIYTWKRYQADEVYHWEKWNVDKRYNSKLSTISTISQYKVDCRSYQTTYTPIKTIFACRGYETYSVNTTSGIVTLTDPTSASYDGSSIHDTGTCYVYPNNTTTTAETCNVPAGSTIYKASRIEIDRDMHPYFPEKAGVLRDVTTMRSSSYNIKGSTSFGDVTSTDENAYPVNGVSGGNWYVKQSEITYQKGSYIDEVKSDIASAYPSDGYLNGYWYELVI